MLIRFVVLNSVFCLFCNAKASSPEHEAKRDMRRAVNPMAAFFVMAPSILDEIEKEDRPEIADDLERISDVRRQFSSNKYKKRFAKLPNKKAVNPKGITDKLKTSKLIPLLNKNINKVNLTEDLKSGELKMRKSDFVPLLNKRKQFAKLVPKSDVALKGGRSKDFSNFDKSKLDGGQESDDNDATGKDVTGDNKDSSSMEKCESSSTESGSCPTQVTDESTTQPTTCRTTQDVREHDKTTCCKTSFKMRLKTIITEETTTPRKIVMRVDEVKVPEFDITVVPLFNNEKRLPQSDPEFINLGIVGQFKSADMSNATILSGQDALDFLEFARNNATEEPVIHSEERAKK